MSVRKACFVFSAFLCFLCLPACGKRGDLEYPSNAAPRRTYPAPIAPKNITVQPAFAVDVPETMSQNPAMQEQVLDEFVPPADAVRQTTAPAYDE